MLETLILFVSIKFSKLKGKDIHITSKNNLQIIEGELLSLARRKSIGEETVSFEARRKERNRGREVFGGTRIISVDSRQ